MLKMQLHIAKSMNNVILIHFRHIREDLGEWVSKVDTHKMTPEELEFHYFKYVYFINNFDK